MQAGWDLRRSRIPTSCSEQSQH